MGKSAEYLSETYKITMASSTLARFTLKPSILRSVAFRPSAYSIWTLSTAAAQKQQQTNHHQQLSLVSGVRWVAPARLYSVSGLTKDAVESRVLTVCKAFDKITADKVSLESHFINDLGLDSLDHVEVIMAVEDEFGFEIPDEHAEKLLTPSKIAQYVCDHEKIFS